MKNLIFVSLLSVALGFPVGSPLHKREKRRHQLGFGHGYEQVNPFYNLFIQPDRYNDFTPVIHIPDRARPSVSRPVTQRPRVTSQQRPTTSMVQPVTFGVPCPPPRGDGLNNDQLPVFFFYVDPKEWSSMGADGPLSPGQSGSNNLQPGFVILPGVFLPASEDGQVTQNTDGLKAPDPLRVTESNRKQKDC